jgi:CIC family chloride channel protein
MKDTRSRAALFQPTYRLIGFSLLVGGIGAAAALGFEALVEFAQTHLLRNLAGYQPPEVGTLDPRPLIPSGWDRVWIPIVTTLGGLASGLIVYTWAPEAEGHGTDAAIAAYHEKGGEVRTQVPLVKAVSSALTIGSGGVAGREGPTAQIAVGLTTLLSRWLGLRGEERRSLLLAGMAAGLAAMFRAPLGMAIFTVEILYAGMVFETEALIYTVIAAVSSYAIFGFFAGWEHLFEIPGGLTFHQPGSLLAFAMLGLIAGVVGALLPTLLYRARDFFHRLPGPPHLKPALGGLLVGLLGMAVPEILGTGYGWVELAMTGRLTLVAVLLLLLIKGPAMALTIGSGGSGGVFAPTVTIGAMLGAAVGFVVQSWTPAAQAPVAAFVVVGMASVFAGAARTPISTLIMVAEMTGGYGLIVPAMLANILAYVVQRSLTHGRRYPTLYESQVERREDSPLHRGVFVRRAVDMIESGDLDASEIRLPRLMHLLRFGEPVRIAEGEGSLVALEVDPGSELDGRTVAESVGTIAGATAVAVLRGSDIIVPRGPTILRRGDRLLAVVHDVAHEPLRRSAAAQTD